MPTRPQVVKPCSLSELAGSIQEFVLSKKTCTQWTYHRRLRSFAKFLGFRPGESLKALHCLIQMPPRRAEEKVTAFKTMMKARRLPIRHRVDQRYGIRPLIDYLGKRGLIGWRMTRPSRDAQLRAWSACPKDLREKGEGWLKTLSIQNYRPITFRTFRKHLVYLGLFLREKHLPLRKLRVPAAMDWIGRLRALPAAPATTNSRISTAKRFCEWLRREGYLPENPFRMCVKMRAPSKLPHALTEDEVKKLIRSARTSLERAFIELLYATGARTGEILSLTISDLSLKDDRLILTGPDGDRRLVPFHRHSAKALRAYLKERARILCESNFPNETALFVQFSGRLNHARMTTLLRHLGRRAGLARPVTAFAIRNSFGVHMLDRGADPFVVKELMGHSTFGSVDRYGRLTTRNMRKVFERTHPREAGRR